MYCRWRSENELMQYYHDKVYGVVKNDSNELFKWLSLEIMQAGLSWQTVINKEIDFDKYYYNFDVSFVALYDYEQLVLELGLQKIIKNKLKLKSIINNANVIIDIEKNQSFFDYLIGLINVDLNVEENVKSVVNVMKKRGFKFIGFEIIKSFFESVGIINNHDLGCMCYKKPLFELKEN